MHSLWSIVETFRTRLFQKLILKSLDLSLCDKQHLPRNQANTQPSIQKIIIFSTQKRLSKNRYI